MLKSPLSNALRSVLTYGGDTVPFPRPFVVPNVPRGTLFYDSIGNQFRAQTNAAGGFNDDMKSYFDPTTAGGLQDMSTDGCALLKSTEDASGGVTWMIDDVTNPAYADWTPSTAQYDTVYDAMSTAANTSDYAIFVSGTNDASVGSDITKANYKLAMLKMKQFIQTNARNFPNIQCAFVMPLHRSDSGASSNANYNTVREAQRELCTEDTWFKILPDTYDLDLVDTAHFTTAVYQTTFASRFADCIAYVFGKRDVTGVYGPLVTSASFNTTYLTLTVEQDDGTDFDTIPAGAEYTLGLRLASQNDYKPSSVSRVSATELRVELEDIGLVNGVLESAVVADGCMSELSATNAEVIKDNAADPKPLRSGVITLTNNDPLWNVQNLALDLIPKTGTKTYSSGVLATQVTDRMNGYWEATGTTREPTYEASAFDGMGALTSGDGTTFLISNTVFTKSNTGWGGIVFEVPATTASNKYLLTFGTAGGGSNQNTFYMTTGGALYMQRDSINAPVLISGAQDLRTTKNVLIWNYRSTSAVDVYLNENAVVTFDPSDNLISWDQITLFNRLNTETGGTVGFKIGRCWHRPTAHDAGGVGTDPSISSVLAALKTLYGTQ